MDYNGAPLVAVEAQPLMILPDNLPAMEMMTRPEGASELMVSGRNYDGNNGDHDDDDDAVGNDDKT